MTVTKKKVLAEGKPDVDVCITRAGRDDYYRKHLITLFDSNFCETPPTPLKKVQGLTPEDERVLEARMKAIHTSLSKPDLLGNKVPHEHVDEMVEIVGREMFYECGPYAKHAAAEWLLPELNRPYLSEGGDLSRVCGVSRRKQAFHLMNC